MSRSDDYFNEMQQAYLTDETVEELLTRTAAGGVDSELEAFIAAIDVEMKPPRDVEYMATALAAAARSTRRSSPRGMVRRLAILASAGAIFVAMTGVALAADDAAPGDFLYGLDRTLENFGIGAGGVDERILEFDELMDQGEDTEAIEMLTEVIESSSESVSAKAQRHLDLVTQVGSPNAAETQERVAEMQELIEENRGNGNGADGSDFGKDVSEKAQSNRATENSGSQGQGANQGQDKGGGPPEDAGPPENAGNSNSNGNSNAGPKKDR